MSATDELRRLLDERGVEHYDGWSGEIRYTKWQGTSSMWFLTHDSFGTDGSMLYVQGVDMTPEQAIAATLGRGTCHVISAEKLGDSFGFKLSCGHSMVNPFNFQPDYCPWCGAKVVEE